MMYLAKLTAYKNKPCACSACPYLSLSLFLSLSSPPPWLWMTLPSSPIHRSGLGLKVDSCKWATVPLQMSLV